ncbi:hypothetical protein N7478_000926 [Penicillium angulare]|uniref:uncharacterized protein n=1 Tax=Penicillium angulare TaxID=116970 RepID=UPI002540F562|nr:uncharacterized protein N7478_000926 [Penicillium angulare]KAJ5291675.1 hypothetical protein N7478_000926 [Penicillium angulare]
MIQIGTHCLYASVSGPPRTPPDPLVVILNGAGDVASSYTALSRLVAVSTRILLYDRSGLGRSDPDPNLDPNSDPNPEGSPAVTAAKELHSLLCRTHLLPPLVLVAHSYGGIVAREYLHLYPSEVAGIVLADSSTERQSDCLQLPAASISAVQGNLKFAQVTGLRAETVLSKDEWRVRAIDISRGAEAAQMEANALVVVCNTLAGKRQLAIQAMGSRPVSVIRCNGVRDYERIYHAGVEVGNGTVEQREEFRALLDRWRAFDADLHEEQLKLSSTSHFVHLPGCGHNIHILRPDVVAEEIGWVLKQLKPQDTYRL